MGLIAAALNAAGGTLASQWKEYFLFHMLLSLHGFRRLFCCAFRLLADASVPVGSFPHINRMLPGGKNGLSFRY